MKSGKVKMAGMKNAKGMTQMFNEILGVSSQNIHIYLEKIVKLQTQHKRVAKHLRCMDQLMFKGKHQ